jgi:hypothetical protein
VLSEAHDVAAEPADIARAEQPQRPYELGAQQFEHPRHALFPAVDVVEHHPRGAPHGRQPQVRDVRGVRHPLCPRPAGPSGQRVAQLPPSGQAPWRPGPRVDAQDAAKGARATVVG